MRCLCTYSGSGWAYGSTFTSLPPQMFPLICESWLISHLMQVYKLCHCAFVEAVEPFKLHPMSVSIIYEMFECLLWLWMGIWLHIHIITSTDTSHDLWELAEIWPYESVQTMPLQARRTFFNCIPCPCHTYMFYLSTFLSSGGAYGFTLTSLPPQTLPQICENWLTS